MPRLQFWKFWMLVTGALSGPVASAVTASAADASFGPLWDDFRLTLSEGRRTEAAGPFYYHETMAENGYTRETWAVPPLFAHTAMDEIDARQTDILWKLISYNIYGEEYRFQILQLFSFTGGGTQSETNAHRFSLFPIYFQQRSAIPEKNYTALLPVYGKLQNRFFRDAIHFAAFPLWVKTRKRDVTTDNYVFPLFHLRYGPSVRGWQFWPLLGRETRETSTFTNVWGDPELVPGHTKSFALWPFFVNHRLGIGTTNEARSQSMIPFYAWTRSPLRDSTTFPWPIGYTHTIDREKNYEEWSAPWPLIVFARGEGKRINRVWPFFSHGTNRNLTSTWFAWPVYKYNRLQSAPLDRARTRILFFLYSDTHTRDTATKRSKRRVDLWPLLSATRELDGNRRLQLLAPLEPLLPGNASLQRDLAPLWSIWRSEKNPAAGRASQSFLWNLWRRDVTPEARKGSILFGLFQYESGRDVRRGRVFYLPFGGKRASTPDAPAPTPTPTPVTKPAP